MLLTGKATFMVSGNLSLTMIIKILHLVTAFNASLAFLISLSLLSTLVHSVSTLWLGCRSVLLQCDLFLLWFVHQIYFAVFRETRLTTSHLKGEWWNQVLINHLHPVYVSFVCRIVIIFWSFCVTMLMNCVIDDNRQISRKSSAYGNPRILF